MTSNQTLYVHNLTEKLKLDDLRFNLLHAFSRFGNVIEIFVSKRDKLRGQAWIVFDELEGAVRAIKEMQGAPFFQRELKVEFAKAKSDVVAKADGTFKAREKKIGSKRARDADEDGDGQKLGKAARSSAGADASSAARGSSSAAEAAGDGAAAAADAAAMKAE